MPRKITPGFHRKQERSKERVGDMTGFYLPRTMIQALADLARTRGISQSALVRKILQADPDIAAQIALYRSPDQEQPDGGAYGLLFAGQPDLWESDQEQPDLWTTQERPDGADQKRAPTRSAQAS